MKPQTNNKRTLICPRTMEPAPNLGLVDDESIKPLSLAHVNCRCNIDWGIE